MEIFVKEDPDPLELIDSKRDNNQKFNSIDYVNPLGASRRKQLLQVRTENYIPQ